MRTPIWPLLLFLCSLPQGFAQGYTFRRILGPDSDPSIVAAEPMGISPTGGIVLLTAKQKDGITGLFTTTGGPLKKVIDDSGDVSLFQTAAINSSGKVVVNGLLDDRSVTVFLVDGGNIRTIFRSSEAADVAGVVYMAPRINEAGTVAVTVRPNPISAAQRGAKILVGDGTNSLSLDQDTTLSGALYVYNPDINNLGQIAFIATVIGGGGLYTLAGDGFHLLAPNSGFTQTFLATSNSPSLNDAGMIAYEAMNDAFQFGILLYHPGRTPETGTIEQVSFQHSNPAVSPFTKVSRPMLNNAGTVAFLAEGAGGAGARGIYTSQAGVRSKVIAAGDTLFGSTVSFLEPTRLSGRYLDDIGQIVFVYALQNGDQGIAIATPTPAVTSGSVSNGATFTAGGLVPGSWAQLKGTGLSTVTRLWGDADFANLAGGLPTNLSGVEVKVGGKSAAVYYISPTQITFQVPDIAPGPVTVQLIRDGNPSNSVSTVAVAGAPGIFPVIVNGRAFTAGLFLDGKITGDPALSPVFRKARPGDLVQLYATGLQISPAGVIPSPELVQGVTVKLGDVTVPADAAALVGVGLFQINFTIPAPFAGLPEKDYPVTIEVGGAASPLNINLGPGLTGPVVIPVQP